MHTNALKSWVQRQKALGFWQHIGLGAVAFVAGILVLFLTFWLTYAIVWFGWQGVSAVSEILFNGGLELSHEIRMVCAAVFVCLLLIQHFRTDPWHWGDPPELTQPTMPGLAAQAGVTGSLLVLLANPAASANMISDILLSGPRLTVGTVKLVQQAFQFRKMDEDGCAQLLGVLLRNPSAVAYEELSAAGWEPWLRQIRGIDGVRFLQKGVTLSSELRVELGTAVTRTAAP